MRTLKRAFLILETLAGAAKKLSLMEITEKTRIDKATCLRFLSSLEEIGVVQRDEKTRLYELGIKALFLGNGFLKTLRIEEKVRRYLERLVLETEETAFYSIRRRDSRVTLYLQESPHETRTLVDLGISIPLTSGCASRAILAFLPEDEIHSILRREAMPRPHLVDHGLEPGPKEDYRDSHKGLCRWYQGESSHHQCRCRPSV
jgi:DNA-binding IclR family transcriptional regulator